MNYGNDWVYVSTYLLAQRGGIITYFTVREIKSYYIKVLSRSISDVK